MKEAVTKIIDMLTQEDSHGGFQKLLERYKRIAAGGDYFEGDESFMCVLSIKVPIWKKSGNLLNEPRTFLRAINVMWNTASRIWIRVADSINYDDTHYTTSASYDQNSSLTLLSRIRV